MAKYDAATSGERGVIDVETGEIVPASTFMTPEERESYKKTFDNGIKVLDNVVTGFATQALVPAVSLILEEVERIKTVTDLKPIM